MTPRTTPVTVSLPVELAAALCAKVDAGDAVSVSALVASVLTERFVRQQERARLAEFVPGGEIPVEFLEAQAATLGFEYVDGRFQAPAADHQIAS